jgi:hypothetical protein
MLRNTKKILITSEKEEVFYILNSQKGNMRGVCLKCEHEVNLMTFNSAVTFSNLSGTTLLNLLVRGKVHYMETLNRHLLICGKSLEMRMENLTKDSEKNMSQIN